MSVNLLIKSMLILSYLSDFGKCEKEDAKVLIQNESSEIISMENVTDSQEISNGMKKIRNAVNDSLNITVNLSKFEGNGQRVEKTIDTVCSSTLTTIIVKLGQKYNFRFHKNIPECKTVFKADKGVLLKFICKNVDILDCSQENYLKIKIGLSEIYYCDLPPPMLDLKKIHLKYKIFNTDSILRCIIIGKQGTTTTSSISTTTTTTECTPLCDNHHHDYFEGGAHVILCIEELTFARARCTCQSLGMGIYVPQSLNDYYSYLYLLHSNNLQCDGIGNAWAPFTDEINDDVFLWEDGNVVVEGYINTTSLLGDSDDCAYVNCQRFHATSCYNTKEAVICLID